MVDDEAAAWREQHRHAVEVRAEAERLRRAAETGQARELVAEFVREAQRRGLPVRPLTAVAPTGARYRTGLTGWYVDVNLTRAVTTDGEFYLLTVPTSLRARLTGVTIEPREPKLIVGEGGRDGESMPLRQLLDRRLDAGPHW
ncbi:hypothetical protein [Micromonospora sp. NBC_01796]|uniref:hypothetical protein n=1 Tax=Micromonospora sp. NBC_01796 TaxID=2975987 RepID=UPI002DDABD7C|nr:hypothetical protein [Micromonospora sp. NBC_01796]WSA86377.1 hypothetical protein OIE47_01790 [Micromonospora sp. NBC_01796]